MGGGDHQGGSRQGAATTTAAAARQHHPSRLSPASPAVEAEGATWPTWWRRIQGEDEVTGSPAEAETSSILGRCCDKALTAAEREFPLSAGAFWRTSRWQLRRPDGPARGRYGQAIDRRRWNAKPRTVPPPLSFVIRTRLLPRRWKPQCD